MNICGIGLFSHVLHHVSLQIKSSAQIEAALSFLANVGPEKCDWSAFEKACGVGMLF